jgi:hypothetical protein
VRSTLLIFSIKHNFYVHNNSIKKQRKSAKKTLRIRRFFGIVFDLIQYYKVRYMLYENRLWFLLCPLSWLEAFSRTDWMFYGYFLDCWVHIWDSILNIDKTNILIESFLWEIVWVWRAMIYNFYIVELLFGASGWKKNWCFIKTFKLIFPRTVMFKVRKMEFLLSF